MKTRFEDERIGLTEVPVRRFRSMARSPLFLVASTFFLGLVIQPESANSAKDLMRTFQVTYDVRLPAMPEGAKELRIWVPLAASNRHQQIRRRVIQVPYRYRVTKDPEYGNDILFLDLRQPLPPALDLSIQYEAIVQGEQVLGTGAPAAASPAFRGKELKPHLKSNRLMVVDDQVRELAKAITAEAQTPTEEAQAIYRYVIERMTYEKQTPGWGQGDTLRACEVGTGNCTDFHSLFISLARARGIPAMFQIGLPVPEKPEGEISGYHCWACFYIEGVGWVPIDASEAWKHREKLDYFFGTYDPNRLAVSTGRDIHLIPKPASGPVNIFFKPYVEVDGKSFDKVETKFRFMDLAHKTGGMQDA